MALDINQEVVALDLDAVNRRRHIVGDRIQMLWKPTAVLTVLCQYATQRIY